MLATNMWFKADTNRCVHGQIISFYGERARSLWFLTVTK